MRVRWRDAIAARSPQATRRGSGDQWRLPLAVGVLLLAACEEPLGPTSPATVDAITKTQGDAEGFERSGTYEVEVEFIDCPCDDATTGRPGAPTIEGLAAFSLCEAVEQSGIGSRLTVEVLATDGIVTFEIMLAAGAELVGPLYERGNFSAGSVTSITSFVAEGRLVTRIDGDFDSTDNGHEFEASLVNRIAGRTTIEAQAMPIDCTERLELAGTWLF